MTIFDLVIRWGAKYRAPSAAEWDEWTQAVHEAAQERARSGWTGVDPIFDEGYAAGFAEAVGQAEEEAAYNPAGRFPYA